MRSRNVAVVCVTRDMSSRRKILRVRSKSDISKILLTNPEFCAC